MIVDKAYKISIFGDYNDIVATAENMQFMLDKFGSMGLLPTTFQELVMSEQLQPPISYQRLALISGDGLKKVTIASNRLDFDIQISGDWRLSSEQISEYNREMSDVLKVILEKFSQKSSRLALNTSSLIVELNEQEIHAFLDKFTNPLSVYHEPLEEWATHMMIRRDFMIGGNQEKVNVITEIEKTEIEKSENDKLLQAVGFSVYCDINTIAENILKRFNGDDILTFAVAASSCWNEIVADVG